MKLKTSGKVKNEVLKENKKPPINKNLQPKTENDQSNPAVIEDIEKEMYKGQNHQEDISNVSQSPPKDLEPEGPTKPIVVKPIETYLQTKISKMDCNQNLMSNIKKELGDKAKTIVKDENIPINQKTKDLNAYLQKEADAKNKNSEEMYANKQRYKEVKKLKDELIKYKSNYNQLEENKKFLHEKDLSNQLNNSQRIYPQETVYEKSKKEQQIKEIDDKMKNIMDKINEIQFQIKLKMEDHKTLTNKEKIKLFLENFERDKEIVEIRAKKYLKESKERGQRMQNDINQLVEKRKKEIEEKDKEQKAIKAQFFQKFKEDEKKIEKRQSKLNEGIILRYKPYMHQKAEKTKKNYLYSKRYESFLKKEEKLFKDKYNKKKKEREKVSYKFEDIEKFAAEFDEKIENRRNEYEQKSMELSKKWLENKEKLPKSNYENSESKKFSEEKKNEDKLALCKKYAQEIRETNVPSIDINKKKEREAIILSLEEPKKTNKKYTLTKQKNKRILLKKKDSSKPSKFKWELKLENSESEQLKDINENLIKKPKRINLQPINRIATEIPEKKPDYLTELINKRIRNRAMSSTASRDNLKDEMFDVNKKSKKWEKALNDQSGTIIQNINNIREKAQLLEKEADQKEKLLQLNGGVENDPKLGKKVTSLLIDSIEAKINILKKMKQI